MKTHKTKMNTIHAIYFKNSSDMCELESNSIDLMVTSPPYPMIKMWDLHFSNSNEKIRLALDNKDGKSAFDLMHAELNKVWNEVARVLKMGGIACINIGDATRKIGKIFQLFPNHIKIIEFFRKIGFIELPCILWRKPTNSPNKFLGSGMLPPNAYITLEHEYILIFRKGGIRQKFIPPSENRYQSAYFWEERNKWFSDIWEDIGGISQKLDKKTSSTKKLRERSAAFPLELPYRLINMFSIYGDKILDPFWGTGTTSLAAIISARNSIGYEISSEFIKIFRENINKAKKLNFNINSNRLNNHVKFIDNYNKEGKDIKYKSAFYNVPVITRQEVKLLLYLIKNYEENQNNFKFDYEKFIFKN